MQGFWLPADLATVVPGGGLAFFVARLPFYFSLFSAPIPPAPFPSGEGGDQGCFMQGALPLASPGLDRLRHLQTLPLWCLRGACPCLAGSADVDGTRRGVCFPCRLLPQPLVCLLAPIPPTPFPAGRGRPRLFHARGFAPCIPGVEPGRHRSRGRIARWRRGLPCLACSPRR